MPKVAINFLRGKSAVADKRRAVQKTGFLQRRDGIADGRAGLHEDLRAREMERRLQVRASGNDMKRRILLRQTPAELGGDGVAVFLP